MAWVGSLLPLGAALSGPAAVYLMAQSGRKNTLGFLCLPLFSSNCFILSAYYWNIKELLLIGRLLGGKSMCCHNDRVLLPFNPLI